LHSGYGSESAVYYSHRGRQVTKASLEVDDSSCLKVDVMIAPHAYDHGEITTVVTERMPLSVMSVFAEGNP
jgi:hypothetical protein